MIARIAARRALTTSIAARQQTVNEHGGWICKDRAEFEKYRHFDKNSIKT